MQDLIRSSKNLTRSLIRYKISHYKDFDILKISKDLINFSIRFLVRWIILGILVRSCRISCKILNKILLGDLSKTLNCYILVGSYGISPRILNKIVLGDLSKTLVIWKCYGAVKKMWRGGYSVWVTYKILEGILIRFKQESVLRF